MHRKVAPVGRADHERAVLRLVQGPGVVPTPTATVQGGKVGDPDVVETIAGNGSLADVLAERSRLSETECRAIGARIASALEAIHERGIVHGDIKPANIVMAPDGELWIADFDAAGAASSPRSRGTPQRLRNLAALDRSDDFVGLALLVAECATGILIDPTVVWSPPALTQLGCSSELAHDLAAVLADPSDPRRVASLLGSPEDRLPRAAKIRTGNDPTPTIDFEPTAIAGLDPLPTTTKASHQPSTPIGWRRTIHQALNRLKWLYNKQSELARQLTNRGG